MINVFINLWHRLPERSGVRPPDLDPVNDRAWAFLGQYGFLQVVSETMNANTKSKNVDKSEPTYKPKIFKFWNNY